MANAQVEKLKALGLRHGEKAVVVLASTLCLLFLVRAVTRPTIDVTPDEVNKRAKAAQTNLEARQSPDDILQKLESEGIKNPGYEQLVDSQAKTALVADVYKVAQAWVSPEPGAGLIRDRPELVAPTELFAYPGRGGALVYALKEGKRIADDTDPAGKKTQDVSTTARRKRKRNRSGRRGGSMAGGMMGGMGMGMGMGMPGMGGPDPNSPEAKKAREAEKKKLARILAGKEGPAKEDEKKKDENAEEEKITNAKEVTKGLRWVAITGVLDHKKMLANYLAALKNPAAANPNYSRLDLRRQSLQPDGSWSDWETVAYDKNRLILDNLPETEEELAAQDAIIENLVDPLPFLKAGLWEKVHVVSLVPKEKKEVGKTVGGMGEGMYGGMSGGMPGMGGASGMPGMMGGMGGGAGMYGGQAKGGMMGGMMGEGMRSGGMMGGSVGGGEENTNFQTSKADTLMIRSLDFTVEPDTTYKFQLRVVVYNPNYKRDDVSPGVDTSSLELFGPWSAETDEVTMPADVTAYAMNKAPGGAGIKRPDKVSFQVVRWDETDGVTVTRNFDAGPGDVIGDPSSAAIPVSDGTGTKNRLVDFNSRQLVVDTAGGARPIASVGATGAPLDAPAISLMLRPDGSAVLRGEFFDRPDPVRKDISDNYAKEMKDSNDKKSRQNSMGGGYGGMMGMGGMPGMGGGMKGGR